MKQVKIFLERWGMHCFLLPIFFILHTYIQYYGLIDAFATLKILLYLEIGISLFLILTHFFTKNAQKASIISTIISSTFLFYGNIKELLSTYSSLSFFAKYSVLLPAIFIFLILISFLINKLIFFQFTIHKFFED